MPKPAVDSLVKPQPHPGRPFYHRFLVAFALSIGLIIFSLGLGVLGYHFIAKLGWVDALLNAAMILTGMGPVNPLTTPAGKVFGIAYALFSGVAFLTMVAMLLAPAAHRLLHRLHLEMHKDDDE